MTWGEYQLLSDIRQVECLLLNSAAALRINSQHHIHRNYRSAFRRQIDKALVTNPRQNLIRFTKQELAALQKIGKVGSKRTFNLRCKLSDAKFQLQTFLLLTENYCRSIGSRKFLVYTFTRRKFSVCFCIIPRCQGQDPRQALNLPYQSISLGILGPA